MRFYEAHCHLQDERLTPYLDEILLSIPDANIVLVSVCGSSEDDWELTKSLSEKHRWIIPSFGVHPWYVKEISKNWFEKFLSYIDNANCGIGEIGLDTWIKGYDLNLQEEIFIRQLRIAAERNLPVSIHCVRAWDNLLKILKTTPLPRCGFLIHSYGGLNDFIKPLAELGAYFSFPGYFASDKKLQQRESFKQIPLDRLLIETDAPDQLPPDFLNRHRLINQKNPSRLLNHPLNLIPIYEYLSRFLNIPLEKLCDIVEQNFIRLFGRIIKDKT